MSGPERGRAQTDKAFEGLGQVHLIAEAAIERDLCDGQVCLGKQALRAFRAAAPYILIGCKVGRPFKQAAEMIGAEIALAGHIRQRQSGGQISLYIILDQPKVFWIESLRRRYFADSQG